jgi:hypothetical protein
MRLLIVSSLLLALAGCGAGGSAFGVDSRVERPADDLTLQDRVRLKLARERQSPGP